MTQSAEDRMQLGHWFFGTMVVWTMTAILVFYSPKVCEAEDPSQLIRYAWRVIIGSGITIPALTGGFVFFDWIWPGSISKKVSEDAKACSYVVAAFLVALALLLSRV